MFIVYWDCYKDQPDFESLKMSNHSMERYGAADHNLPFRSRVHMRKTYCRLLMYRRTPFKPLEWPTISLEEEPPSDYSVDANFAEARSLSSSILHAYGPRGSKE